jgi:hypothetical protein
MLRLALILAVFLLACGSPQAENSVRQQRPAPSSESVEPVEHSEFLAAAKASTNRLQLDLKRELSAAMSESGPVGAIQVCSQRATVLTAEVSERTGLDVRRVSLRHRNPENRATPGEASVLAMMAARTNLTDTMIVRDGAPLYMRAIRINTPLCLQCHGAREDLAPEVLDQLASLYADDQATGFAEGDLRGAFVVKPLAE